MVLDLINTGLQAGTQVLNQINQHRTWKREDTAVQRRVADLKAAGLSPTLAAGSAATSSAPIRLDSPTMSRDVEAQSAGIAQTRAQRSLTIEQAALSTANRRLADANVITKEEEAARAQYNLEALNTSADGGPTFGYQLALANVRRLISEANEATRNIDIYRRYGVPSNSRAADDVISSQELVRNLFPGLPSEKLGSVSVLLRTLVPLVQSIRGGK